MLQSRRQWLQSTAISAASLAVASVPTQSLLAQAAQPPAGPFTLPALPYAPGALDPSIDERTMQIHHGRHHQAYVNGLNTAVANHPDLQKMTVEQLLKDIKNVPMAVRQAVINHGGGHYNHSMFWQIMRAPTANNAPAAGNLADAINSTFQSFANFKTLFAAAAMGRFGSGWAWLVKDGNRLEIISSGNQDCPLMEGKTPLLGLDVWEHAYYLKYQNVRADYVAAWWNVVNWPAVAMRM